MNSNWEPTGSTDRSTHYQVQIQTRPEIVLHGSACRISELIQIGENLLRTSMANSELATRSIAASNQERPVERYLIGTSGQVLSAQPNKRGVLCCKPRENPLKRRCFSKTF